ncbi:hypothetical protein [Streptomyces acidicola]|uniref:hypothetical protein n=1 Tax=Streptomyces acidicola TaxID=2596892 RepID=UPI001D137318|nr:hypothetical protein [Streptomyces acidicola]
MTLVSDATAAFLPEMLYAAHERNRPTCTQAILTTDRLVEGFAAQVFCRRRLVTQLSAERS